MATEDTSALTFKDMILVSFYRPSDNDTLTGLRHIISLSETLRADLLAKGIALLSERDALKAERAALTFILSGVEMDRNAALEEIRVLRAERGTR